MTLRRPSRVDVATGDTIDLSLDFGDGVVGHGVLRVEKAKRGIATISVFDIYIERPAATHVLRYARVEPTIKPDEMAAADPDPFPSRYRWFAADGKPLLDLPFVERPGLRGDEIPDDPPGAVLLVIDHPDGSATSRGLGARR